MMEAVHRYDGYVAQSTGDGIFALFGAPVAHEDHPQRALHAALAMQQKLRRYAEQAQEPGPAAHRNPNWRQHERSSRAYGSHWRTCGVCARRSYGQSCSADADAWRRSDCIAASETTRRLCEGYFDLHATSDQTSGQGHQRSCSTSTRLLGLGPLRTHFQLSAQRGFTQVRRARARDGEPCSRVFELGGPRSWSSCRDGSGGGHRQVAPGATNSRRRCRAECKVLEAYSVSHGKASAWQPVLELLRKYFNITDHRRRGNAAQEAAGESPRGLSPRSTTRCPIFIRLMGASPRGPRPWPK